MSQKVRSGEEGIQDSELCGVCEAIIRSRALVVEEH